MAKKYKFSLFILGFLLFVSLAITTTYGVWLSNQDDTVYNTETLECFKVYFSNGNTYEQTNIKSVINEEGKKTSPRSIAVTNICNETKELQIRLNILNDNTINTNALTIEASGHIEQDEVLYSDLETKKTSEEDVTISKLLGLIKVEPNETVRTNIKVWFDERKAPIIDSKKVFKARYELIDTASSIKSTFAETLLKDINNIDTKPSPNFGIIATENEGMYLLNENGVKNYYYRGMNESNYVYFANTYWRIVGVNNKNQVKLITANSTTFMNYSDYNNAIDYTGYKLIFNNELINNNITNYLYDWYNNTIVNQGLDAYVADNGFCNDASNYVNYYHTYFSGYTRLITNKAPTLTCPQTNVDFGGTYTQKVGLITADEVALAGGVFNTENTLYYLNNGEAFYTGTPIEYHSYQAFLGAVNHSGTLTEAWPNSWLGVRPVILLNPSITVSGNGTINDPYTLDELN